MPKQIIYGEEAREKLLAGVNKIANAVTVTLSPKGANVAINKGYGSPDVIHDGASIAKEIDLECPFENMGAQLVKEASTKTNEATGDGTTTAMLLAQKLVQEGMKNVTAGFNPIFIKRGMDKAVELLIKEIKLISKDVKKSDWEKVATISAQNEAIGKKVAEAITLVGENGVVEVEKGSTSEIVIKHREGMILDSGYASPYFAVDSDKQVCEIPNAYVLVVDEEIQMTKQIIPLLEEFMEVSKNLVIVCDDISHDALKGFIRNKLNGALNINIIKTPGFGDRKGENIKDIATLVGANLVTSEKGMKLEDVRLKDLGRADVIKSTNNETTIIGGAGKKADIKNRIKVINTQIDKTVLNFDKSKLVERRNRLSGGVAVIEVGANTETEMKDLKERVIDAKFATQSAIKMGIVPGGGITLINAGRSLNGFKQLSKDEQVGFELIKEVVKEPIKLLAENSGEDGGRVLGRILDQGDPKFGYNVITGEYGNMVDMGIIEPTKIAIETIKNASSVAGMIITTKVLINEVEEK